MQYVKLFEQFINEFLDMNDVYPYTSDVDGSSNGELFYATYNFKTNSGKNYDATIIVDTNKKLYEFNFKVVGRNYGQMTGDKDSIKVLATIGKIFKEILYKHTLLPIPIKIKGMPKDSDDPDQTSSRDRIYKYMVKKEIAHVKPGNPLIKGYELVDKHAQGFLLVPITTETTDKIK